MSDTKHNKERGNKLDEAIPDVDRSVADPRMKVDQDLSENKVLKKDEQTSMRASNLLHQHMTPSSHPLQPNIFHLFKNSTTCH